jgi:hypothetical protein
VVSSPAQPRSDNSLRKKQFNGETRLSLTPGKSLLHYELIEQIGAGGMGVRL